MEQLYHAAPYTGYVYPNETVIPWSILIVVYPYMTGLVAGAFSVSSFYHVFGMQRFKPVAKFALLTALCFMIFVPAPLLLHLGHPERAFNAMITPHMSSAFAAFGYFALIYVCLLVLEVFFLFREDNVARAEKATGVTRQFYRALTLWSDDVSQRARDYDSKWLFALAVTGIPLAHGLHGYVGFVFGSLKAREWWGSDLMPIIFLFSAVVSGIAVLIVLYVVVSKMRKVAIDQDCLLGLAYALWGFLMFTVLLEGIEFATLVYKGKEGIELIMEYIRERLVFRFFVLQFGIGAMVPIAWLAVLTFRRTRGRAMVIGVFISALLVLMSVFFMRWNVVIGGQEIAKTLKGLLTYRPTILGSDGIVAAMSVLAAPLALLWLVTRICPPWQENSRTETQEPSV
ncbi:MAG: NrfD/PsrC family molybdoenzyme membrane anchor subunit [Kiloniellaceae bacterium]